MVHRFSVHTHFICIVTDRKEAGKKNTNPDVLGIFINKRIMGIKKNYKVAYTNTYFNLRDGMQSHSWTRYIFNSYDDLIREIESWIPSGIEWRSTTYKVTEVEDIEDINTDAVKRHPIVTDSEMIEVIRRLSSGGNEDIEDVVFKVTRGRCGKGDNKIDFKNDWTKNGITMTQYQTIHGHLKRCSCQPVEESNIWIKHNQDKCYFCENENQ